MGLFELEELGKYLPFSKAMNEKTQEFEVNSHELDIAIHRPYFHVKPREYELH